MAFDYEILTEITTVDGSSASALYTNAASTKTSIRLMILHNSNTSAETVKLYNVPDSTGSVGTAGVTNKIFERSLIPNETYVWNIGAPGIIQEDTNDTLQGVTSTSSKVTFQAFGGAE
jgi:hypothetical protein